MNQEKVEQDNKDFQDFLRLQWTMFLVAAASHRAAS